MPGSSNATLQAKTGGDEVVVTDEVVVVDRELGDEVDVEGGTARLVDGEEVVGVPRCVESPPCNGAPQAAANMARPVTTPSATVERGLTRDSLQVRTVRWLAPAPISMS